MSATLPCPLCQSAESKIINSRACDGGVSRRRECRTCGHRYSTIETYSEPRLKRQDERDTIRRLGDKMARLDEVLRHAVSIAEE